LTTLYTDGSCLENPNGPGGWGFVVIENDVIVDEMSGHDPSTTNNRMEMTAAIRGLEQTQPSDAVEINSDSQYVINTMTKGWKRKANQDLWADLDRLVDERRVTWKWVKAHVGHELNEKADKLANDAAHGFVVAGGQSPEAAEESEQLQLTHILPTGEASMVDVGEKAETERVAVARGTVVMAPETLRLIRDNALEKGDVLSTARLAGIMAAKKTDQLIPLCHQIPLNQVTVDFDTSADDRIEIEASTKTTYKTGVEMEALTAVSVAALTIYDMAKAIDRGMRIEAVRMVRKSGGKSGDWEFD
jgi:cyclic pyranopterin phosphate synthase